MNLVNAIEASEGARLRRPPFTYLALRSSAAPTYDGYIATLHCACRAAEGRPSRKSSKFLPFLPVTWIGARSDHHASSLHIVPG